MSNNINNTNKIILNRNITKQNDNKTNTNTQQSKDTANEISDLTNNNFNSLILEFKENKENVLSIIKIILSQKKVEDFKKFLKTSNIDNKNQMRKFIKEKYSEFVESITVLKDCKTLINITEEVLEQLQSSITEFLVEFGEKFVKKNELSLVQETLNTEQSKLKKAYVMFVYLGKANNELTNKRVDSSIYFTKLVEEKILTSIPSNSAAYKKGFVVFLKTKGRIISYIETNIQNWLDKVNQEQESIGNQVYNKVVNKSEKFKHKRKLLEANKNNNNSSNNNNTDNNSNNFLSSAINNQNDNQFNNYALSDIKVSKQVKESLIYLKSTSNLNFMLNKSSLIKNSILKENQNSEDFNLTKIIENLNIQLLETQFTLLKKINPSLTILEFFRNNRKILIKTVTSFKKPYNSKEQLYEKVFSENIGFLIVNVALFELVNVVYDQSKFNDSVYYLIEELATNISVSNINYHFPYYHYYPYKNEFDFLQNTEDYFILENACFNFLKCVNYIGLSEKVYSINITEKILEVVRSKIQVFTFQIITKNQDILTSELYSETCNPVLANNQEEYAAFISNYHFDNEDINKSFVKDLLSANDFSLSKIKSSSNFNNSNVDDKSILSKYVTDKSYPIKLPFTQIVFKFISLYKQYIDKVYKFTAPIYSEPAAKLETISNEFIKKLIECLISFSNFSEGELPILLCAWICNNIKYIYYSRVYLKEYLTTLTNPKFELRIENDKSFEEAWISYEELIYDKLKKKLQNFISDLVVNEKDFTELRKEDDNNDIEIFVTYLQPVYSELKKISYHYVDTCFYDAMCFIPRFFFDLIFNPKIITQFNINFILNLEKDINTIQEFFNEIGKEDDKFLDCLSDLYKLLNFFIKKETDSFISIKKVHKSISKKEFIYFIQRFKNLKKKSMNNPAHITESDIQIFLKKMNN